MSKNSIDKHIAEKLKNREFTPSASAWERLSTQLDEQEAKQKKNWFLYFGYVASIALVLSIGYSLLQKTNDEEPVENSIVETENPTDTNKIQEVKKEVFKEEVPVETVVAKVEKVKTKLKTKKVKTKIFKQFETPKEQLPKILKEETVIASASEENISKKEIKNTFKVPEIKKDTSVKIKVNADDLLYAVTHTQEEVRAYYVQNNINRKDLLNTIEKQLEQSKLSVNPETILAEVENDIYKAEETKESFMDKFKYKLNKVIVAIADRNK